MKSFKHFMHNFTLKRKILISALCVLALAILLCVAVWWFVQDIAMVRQAGGLHPDYHRQGLQDRIPTVSAIEPWMTFEYITIVFKLPPLYLADTLDITSSRYPRIEIDKYAKSIKKDPSVVLQEVQNAVTAYNSQ